MAEVRVRKLEDWVVAALRARAKRHRRSLEGELRELLREQAIQPRKEFAAEARVMLEELRAQYGTFSDSAAEIRAEREERESRW